MLALGCGMSDESQYRRAIARRYWPSLPAGLFLDGPRPLPAGLIPVTRRTCGWAR